MPFRSAFLAIAVAATALFSVPQSARAELLLFTITGHINANFTLDSNAAPDSTDIFGAPSYLNVVGSFSGGPPFTFPILQFFDGIHSGGGLLLWQLPDIIYVSLANGPHLYSNSPPPLFATGTFTYTNETLVISRVAAAVPETSTWAMMILGFLGVGFLAYRRKDTAVHFA